MPINMNLLVESITAVIAGSIVSLLNRFVINNPNCQIGQECQDFERVSSDSESNSTSVASSTVVTTNSSPHTHIPH